MTSEKDDATRIAIPFVISGDLPLVLIVAMILADNASMGASDRATRNVPNILDESDTSGILAFWVIRLENRPPSRLWYTEVVITNPASTVPLNVRDQRGDLEPNAAEYRANADTDQRKKGAPKSFVISQGSAIGFVSPIKTSTSMLTGPATIARISSQPGSFGLWVLFAKAISKLTATAEKASAITATAASVISIPKGSGL